MTIRLFPKSSGASHAASGRQYSAQPGSFVDVPDHDAAVLQANGWMPAAVGKVGITSQRPTPALAARGETFIDTTVPAVVLWDGVNWRNVLTGAVA